MSEFGETPVNISEQNEEPLKDLSFEGLIDNFLFSEKFEVNKQQRRDLILHLAGFESGEAAAIIGNIQTHAVSQNLTEIRRRLNVGQHKSLRYYIWQSLNFNEFVF